MAKRVEVVFREDIENVAKRGERRVVAGGYWRNFLWPKGLAVLAATKEAKKLAATDAPRTEKAPTTLQALPKLAKKPTKQSEKRLLKRKPLGSSDRGRPAIKKVNKTILKDAKLKPKEI